MAKDYPIFALQELVLRLSELDPRIGHYLSYSIGDHGCHIATTGGSVRISTSFITRQYHQPQQISDREIAQLAAGFMANQAD